MRHRIGDYLAVNGHRLSALSVFAYKPPVGEGQWHRYVEDHREARALYAQLQERVPTYVTPASDKRIADCGGIPNGFVLQHDASVSGSAGGSIPPAAQSGNLDGDSGVALSEISRTNTYNHEQFRRCRQALIGWENWYPSVKKLYEQHLIDQSLEQPR
jgi:hypothetical protein